MCGIIGFANSNDYNRPKWSQWLQEGSAQMVHRGPDDSGYWLSDNSKIGFAHTRLSIIDLTSAGHQPMHDHSGNFTITFNGEIYNYRELRHELTAAGAVFKSNSDTEVILESYRHWGKSCVQHFNGMFAFVIYDDITGLLFCARDRVGEKPFFYYHNNGCLLFSSELKGMLSHPDVSAKINTAALDAFLYMGFVPGQACVLEGFNKLPPGHAMEYNPSTNTLTKWHYWSVPVFEKNNENITLSKLSTSVEELLEDAVGRQLVADVPVGILLSGGIDSSLITALASRRSSDVATFTVRFPNAGQFDESAHASLIADHFGTRHVEIDASAASIDLLPELASQYDEPIIDSSIFPTYLVSKLVKEHCTVALGGDGGDELFGGYIHYSHLLKMRQKTSILPTSLRQLIANTGLAILPMGFKGRNMLSGFGADFNNGLPMLSHYFDKTARENLLSGVGLGCNAEAMFCSRIPEETDLLRRATLQDFSNYLPEDILVKVDRASMLNSLEIRAPFLDYRIVEKCYRSIPSHLKTTTNDKKIVLKSIAKNLLPSSFDLHRKQGFSVPLSQWLNAGPWRDFFHDVLLDKQTPFHKPTIIALFKGQDRGWNNAEKLFGLVMLELWRRCYSVSFEV